MRRGPLAAALALVLVLPAAQPASAAVATCPRIIGHKAGGDYAPENTLEGIAATAAQGARDVEMDVRWTASHFPVLMHDKAVDRTTNGTGDVASLWFGYTTGLYAADYQPWAGDPRWDGVRVPYAWDFLTVAKQHGLGILLDVKTTPSREDADKLAEYLDRTGTRSSATYMASPASVAAMRGWHPGLAYAIIEYPPDGMIRSGDSIRAAGASAYAVPWDRITPQAVAYWRSYGLRVLTWTSDRPEWDEPQEWQHVTLSGVDALITNRPAPAAAWQVGNCEGLRR